MTFADVQTIYKPTVIRRDNYENQLRCKVKFGTCDSKPGLVTKCYDGQLKENWNEKSEFKKASIIPMVHIKSVYFMASACGLVVDMHDMMVAKHSSEPFAVLFAQKSGESILGVVNG